ncbi:hypothetical protein ACFL55_01580 [Candidatus Latescibacterota bacterium]
MPTLMLVVLAVLVLAAILVWYLFFRGPDLKKYAFLNNPRIITLPDTRVLEVSGRGSPAEVAKNGFTTLFKIYFKLKGAPKGPKMPLPRGRWVFTSPQDREILGQVALPVPGTITDLPDNPPAPGMTVKLTTWEYGDVAEILHLGHYENEVPTVKALETFIAGQGYERTGIHEELYLRGPGMLGKGNPEKYVTILRFPVKRKTP